jgi:hypothetical protein
MFKCAALVDAGLGQWRVRVFRPSYEGCVHHATGDGSEQDSMQDAEFAFRNFSFCVMASKSTAVKAAAVATAAVVVGVLVVRVIKHLKECRGKSETAAPEPDLDVGAFMGATPSGSSRAAATSPGPAQSPSSTLTSPMVQAQAKGTVAGPERTFVLLKPDALQRGKLGAAIAALEVRAPPLIIPWHLCPA